MRIILTTDFSPKADFAIEQALSFFDSDHHEIYLIHAFKSLVPYTDAPAIPVMHNDELEKDLRKKFDRTLSLVSEKHNVKGIFRRGTTSEVINEVVDEIQADMIVAGVKEGNAFERKTFGSNAEELIDHTEVPLLLIPLDRPLTASGRLGLVSDLKNKLTNQSSKTLGLVQQALDADLIVSNIYDEGSAENAKDRMVDSDFHKSLNHLTHEHIPFYCNDPYEGIMKFTKNYKIHLVAVIPHKRGFFEALFHESITKKLNLDSIIPMLILRENKS